MQDSRKPIPVMAKHGVFDTETTGLFLFKDEKTGIPVPADDPRQPRLCSFAMIYLDAAGLEVGRTVKLIKPDGWELSEEAAAVNVLTMERLHDEGVPVAEVLDEWTEGVRERRLDFAAFNAQHDMKVLRAELRRAGRDDMFQITRNICLMRASHSAGVIKPDNGKGFPKLEHACAHFGIVLTDKHTALGDAMAAADVWRKLKSIDLLPEAIIHYAKNHPGNATTKGTYAKREKPGRKAGPADALDEIPA